MYGRHSKLDECLRKLDLPVVSSVVERILSGMVRLDSTWELNVVETIQMSMNNLLVGP